MRGTLVPDDVDVRKPGIIPAYAGNTNGWTGWYHCGRDHPRVCGEHCRFHVQGHVFEGSSPRMRGTHGSCRWLPISVGIIPAYAGNTLPIKLTECPKRDHPRVCGEHICSGSYVITVPGSSPRMRGTRSSRTVGDGIPGIIPAYAGNTHAVRSALRFSQDHPRVCGEHAFGTSAVMLLPGSSPRMRGTLIYTLVT